MIKRVFFNTFYYYLVLLALLHCKITSASYKWQQEVLRWGLDQLWFTRPWKLDSPFALTEYCPDFRTYLRVVIHWKARPMSIFHHEVWHLVIIVVTHCRTTVEDRIDFTESNKMWQTFYGYCCVQGLCFRWIFLVYVSAYNVLVHHAMWKNVHMW